MQRARALRRPHRHRRTRRRTTLDGRTARASSTARPACAGHLGRLVRRVRLDVAQTPPLGIRPLGVGLVRRRRDGFSGRAAAHRHIVANHPRKLGAQTSLALDVERLAPRRPRLQKAPQAEIERVCDRPHVHRALRVRERRRQLARGYVLCAKARPGAGEPGSVSAADSGAQAQQEPRSLCARRNVGHTQNEWKPLARRHAVGPLERGGLVELIDAGQGHVGGIVVKERLDKPDGRRRPGHEKGVRIERHDQVVAAKEIVGLARVLAGHIKAADKLAVGHPEHERLVQRGKEDVVRPVHKADAVLPLRHIAALAVHLLPRALVGVGVLEERHANDRSKVDRHVLNKVHASPLRPPNRALEHALVVHRARRHSRSSAPQRAADYAAVNPNGEHVPHVLRVAGLPRALLLLPKKGVPFLPELASSRAQPLHTHVFREESEGVGGKKPFASRCVHFLASPCFLVSARLHSFRPRFLAERLDRSYVQGFLRRDTFSGS